jgi:GH35 family endo-1,4-beta-xylanase
MVSRGVPINAVGMQTHWGALEGYPTADPSSVAAQMKRLGDLGLDVYITEMDVPIEKPVTPKKIADQAETYGGMLRTCLAAPNCKGLIVFGTNDANYRAAGVRAPRITEAGHVCRAAAVRRPLPSETRVRRAGRCAAGTVSGDRRCCQRAPRRVSWRRETSNRSLANPPLSPTHH